MLSEREDHFLVLNGWIKTYKNGRVTTANWAFEEDDISDLKRIAFDYIRSKYEGKEFRQLGNTGKGVSVFKTKDAWAELKKMHLEMVAPITEKEQPIEEYRESRPDADITKVLEARDQEWTDLVEETLSENLQRATNMAQSAMSDNPVKQIDLAISNISLINENSDKFKEEKVFDKLNELFNKVSSMLKNHPVNSNGKD